MSSAMPAAFSAAISMMTTSASSLTAMARATVAPTLPAPPTTVTLRFITLSSKNPFMLWCASALVRSCRAECSVPTRTGARAHQCTGALQALNHGIREFRGLELGRSWNHACQVVRHLLVVDGLLQAADDQVRRLGPAQVAEHQLAGQDDGPGIDLVEIGVFRGRAVRGLEHGVAGHVINVAAGGDADAADLGCQRIGNVVVVQVERRNHIVLGRTREDLLEKRVGNGVLYDDPVGQFAPGTSIELHGAELAPGKVISPIAEAAFRELHDVAFVHERHALALVGDGVLQGRSDQTLAALSRHGLDPECG